MVVYFTGNTKADQEGDTTAERKRLYANPYMPNVCAILAIAVYTWCKCRVQDQVHLFDGADQKKRYYNCLVKATESIPADIDMGCSRLDIGTHSNRKFAESC